MPPIQWENQTKHSDSIVHTKYGKCDEGNTHFRAEQQNANGEELVTDCSGGEEGKLFSVQVVCLQDCHGSGWHSMQKAGRPYVGTKQHAPERDGSQRGLTMVSVGMRGTQCGWSRSRSWIREDFDGLRKESGFYFRRSGSLRWALGKPLYAFQRSPCIENRLDGARLKADDRAGGYCSSCGGKKF